VGGWGGQIDNVELFELQDWGYFHKSWKIEQLRAKVQSLREAYVKMTYDQRNRHLISLLWDAETHQVIAAPHHSSPAPAGQTWRQWRSLTLSVGGYPTVLDVAVEAHARQVLQDGLSPIRGPDQRFARDSLVRGRLGPNFGGLFLVLGGVVGCRALWLALRLFYGCSYRFTCPAITVVTVIFTVLLDALPAMLRPRQGGREHRGAHL